jgi:DNA-binding LytR/AlgR family response regulator
MNVALCDDELPELECLRLLVEGYGQGRQLGFNVSCFHSGDELLASMVQGRRFAIIFLDVIMRPSSGIQTARKIRGLDTNCSIIFATNSRAHAIDGYGVRALHYLLKPVGEEALAEVLDQAMQAQSPLLPKGILIKTRQGSHSIPLDNIVFAESDARVIIIHKRSQETIRFYERLDNFELQCQDARFLRCHKSFLVNLDFVRSIVQNSITMETGQLIPVSISISRAKEVFASYMASKI